MKTTHADLRIPVNALVPFLILTFGLSWGIIALYVALPEMMTGVFGQITGNHPLFLLAIYAPSIAATIIVARRAGTEGLRGLFGRMALWRCSRAWYVFLLVAVPLLFVVGAALGGKGPSEWLPAGPISALPGAVALMAVKGAFEEPGWRGFALPLLQRRLPPFWAGLGLGLIWGVWHLPAFLMSDTVQSHWSFMPFVAGSMALSVIFTAMFNASRGSILLPMLLHFQLINPLWPDAQPYDNALFMVVAAIMVLLNREAMFNRACAVTEVVR